MRRREVCGEQQRVGLDAVLEHLQARGLGFIGGFAELGVPAGLEDLHRVMDGIDRVMGF